MNYQEFIKNIYTSLKSINLKQQHLEEHFDTVFQKIDNLDTKINTISNKLDDFIDTNNKVKEEKQLVLSKTLTNVVDNLKNIQDEQDDIINTMNDVRNIEENMSVLMNDYLNTELETHLDLDQELEVEVELDQIPGTNLDINLEYKLDINTIDTENKNIENKNTETKNDKTNENTLLLTSPKENKKNYINEDDLLILE